MPSDWTEERTELLRELWADGLSCSIIAIRLGGVTRNAVIGKVHRLGLGGRPARVSAIRRRARLNDGLTPFNALRGPRKKRADGCTAARKLNNPPKPLPLPPEPIPPPTCEPITFDELRANTCRWPIGDPRESSFRFCGSTDALPGPYCPYHLRLAYVPAAEVRRVEAGFSRLAAFGGRAR